MGVERSYYASTIYARVAKHWCHRRATPRSHSFNRIDGLCTLHFRHIKKTPRFEELVLAGWTVLHLYAFWPRHYGRCQQLPSLSIPRMLASFRSAASELNLLGGPPSTSSSLYTTDAVGLVLIRKGFVDLSRQSRRVAAERTKAVLPHWTSTVDGRVRTN